MFVNNPAPGLQLQELVACGLDAFEVCFGIAFAVSRRLVGQGLAQLHNMQQPQFGLANDNYIGLNPQRNILSDNWGAFFVNYRLIPQIQWVKSLGLRDEWASILQRKREVLVRFLNESVNHASLLHGDLWSGNVMFDDEDICLNINTTSNLRI